VSNELREPRERVSPRARSMWLVGCLTEGLVLIAILVAVALAWNSLGVRWWLVGAAVVLVLGYAAIVPRWRYHVHRWEVSDTAVYTQTGWWARERRIAPMSRIQTVDYAEGALSRLFGLATVTVTTASAAGALRIEGLDKGLAQGLVDELTLKADAVEGDAT
jgi:membrane protein YdbS with pleckstrin-like domain